MLVRFFENVVDRKEKICSIITMTNCNQNRCLILGTRIDIIDFLNSIVEILKLYFEFVSNTFSNSSHIITVIPSVKYFGYETVIYFLLQSWIEVFNKIKVLHFCHRAASFLLSLVSEIIFPDSCFYHSFCLFSGRDREGLKIRFFATSALAVLIAWYRHVDFHHKFCCL